jgi:hypothetical protein
VTPIAPPAPPRIGRLTRIKHTAPHRLYCWPALCFLLLGMLLHAGYTGGWSWFLLAELPGLLLVAFGLEAARRSLLTLPDAIRLLRGETPHG